VTSFANELQHPAHPLDPKLAGAVPASIMGMYAAETLPVLSGLAKGFAVCDGWFASVPTQTFPNRAFAVAGTSLGYTDTIADPEAKVKTLRSAADQYNFIQQRRAAWRAAGRLLAQPSTSDSTR
jgi:phospholipase C